MPAPNDIDDETTCDDPASVWLVVVAAGSVLLGYIVGRISYGHDLRNVLRRIESSSESFEPIEISVRTL